MKAVDKYGGSWMQQGSGDKEEPAKARYASKIRAQYRIARFKGATIIEVGDQWLDMTSDRFSEACYTVFGSGMSKSRISDLEHLFRTTAPDLSSRAHLIAFGSRVWDMRKLDWVDTPSEDCVYRVPYTVRESEDKPIGFVMDLACDQEGVYDDIMQSVAPVLMDKKPTGVIWYLGTGANGKSTLVHLLYLIFGPYLTEITVKQLEDERDTPQLNGKLANICKESSEGFVEDTRTYKSIGTHESFSVHKFHSQDMVTIEGNVHHIFSANNIPTFGDKSYGARRRTLVVPFNNRFRPDETFEDRTFTKAFIERFLSEMVRYARVLKEQNYEYKFSDTTVQMKEKYDTDANTAQTYVDELTNEGVTGFTNFRLLEADYQNWCQEHGYKPSSINVLRRAMDEKGFIRRSVRNDKEVVSKVYALDSTNVRRMVSIKGRTGVLVPSDDETPEELPEKSEQQQILEQW